MGGNPAMLRGQAQKAYADYTTQASAIVRNLAFAGIAIVWLFRYQQGDSTRLPADLARASFALVLALAFDLAQYVLGGIVWGVANSKATADGKGPKDPIVTHRRMTWPMNYCYVTKIALVGLAYALILAFLWSELGLGSEPG